MKKVFSIALVSVLLITLGGVAFASTFDTPAEIYANVTGKTVEEVYEERGTDMTFGPLADENGLLEEFRALSLESKKAIIDERVKDGTLTQEEADEILKAMENCTLEPGTRKLGQEYGLHFGGNGQGQGFGRGQGRGFGRSNNK